jgi:L-ribulose-5-phosphate 3-epimerase
VRLGYNTNGLAHHRLEDALRLLADHGYRAVALTPDVSHLDPFRSTPAEVERIAALLARLDLLPVVETGARYVLDPARKHRPNLLEDDPDARAVRLDFLLRCVRLGRDLGASVVSLWSGAVPEGVHPDAARGRLVEGLRRLIDAAAAERLSVGFEPEPGMLVETVAQYRQLRSEVGHDLKLVLDVGHLLATREGDPAETILARREDLVQVHLEDARAGEHVHLLPGDGELDFGAVKAALVAAGYQGAVCFELSRHSHEAHRVVPFAARVWNDPAVIAHRPRG